jgi:hypothetical protein
MVPGDALLIHGTLPPAHIRARRWFDEPELRQRAEADVPEELRRGKPPGDGTGTRPATPSPMRRPAAPPTWPAG